MLHNWWLIPQQLSTKKHIITIVVAYDYVSILLMPVKVKNGFGLDNLILNTMVLACHTTVNCTY